MAFSPISFIASNYRDYKNNWLKAYEPGTTTPKVMATDSTLITQIAKAQINADGFIVSASQALIIPYIDGAYDLWLFPTEADADNNDTILALRVADSITGVKDSAGNLPQVLANASRVIPFDTLQLVIDSTDTLKISDGAALNLKDRSTGNGGGAMWDVVLTSSVTPNTFNIVVCVGFPLLSVVLRDAEKSTLAQWGNDNASAQAMALELGFILISHPVTFTTDTFEFPIYFNYGAYINVNVGNTLTINSRVESIRQFIFRGDGDYLLVSDADSGEDARMTHASWFNIFPTSDDDTIDLAPLITKAYASFGNLRESIIDFDIGRYHLKSKVDVTRAGWVRASGTRNTVFVCTGDGYDAFETLGDGCKFTDFQFETPLPVVERVNAWIRISHGQCEVNTVNMGQSDKGLIIDGNDCRVDNLLAVWGTKRPANSSLILIESGSGHRINGILSNTSVDKGPEQLVHVGGPTQSGTINTVSISNLIYATSSRAVFLDADIASIVGINIDGIQSTISSGTPANELVKIKTQNSSLIEGVNITGITATAQSENGVNIECVGGAINDINIDDSVLRGTVGTGVQIIRTGGTIDSITVGGNFNAKGKQDVLTQTGNSITNIDISPLALPEVRPAYCYDFTINDDDFAQIDFDRSIFSGVVMITMGSLEFGQFMFRAASTPVITPMITSSANIDASTAVLTGTTGADGKITISSTAGNSIYIENRIGSTQRFSVNILTGI